MDCDSNTSTIIIDNGSSNIKVGFGGFFAPKNIFRSIVRRPKYISTFDTINDVFVGDDANIRSSILSLKYPIEKGIVTNWEDMVKIWEHAFKTTSNHCDPSKHPVLLIESIINTKPNREKAAQIMFETFNIPRYYADSQEKFSLYAAGKMDGLVCFIF